MNSTKYRESDFAVSPEVLDAIDPVRLDSKFTFAMPDVIRCFFKKKIEPTLRKIIVKGISLIQKISTFVLQDEKITEYESAYN